MELIGTNKCSLHQLEIRWSNARGSRNYPPDCTHLVKVQGSPGKHSGTSNTVSNQQAIAGVHSLDLGTRSEFQLTGRF
jgi:hypothetical protein